MNIRVFQFNRRLLIAVLLLAASACNLSIVPWSDASPQIIVITATSATGKPEPFQPTSTLEPTLTQMPSLTLTPTVTATPTKVGLQPTRSLRIRTPPPAAMRPTRYAPMRMPLAMPSSSVSRRSMV